MTIEERKEALGKTQYRSITVNQSAINKEARTIELAFSSEAPVERYWGIEILDHTPSSCDMSRLLNGAPFLDMHNADCQLGVVENARIDADRIGRATIRMSKRADVEGIFQDMIDGIRTKISVGYKFVDDPVKVDSTDDTYRAMKWMPLEISSVSIAADDSVGIGRSAAPLKVDIEKTIPAALDSENGRGTNQAGDQTPLVERTITMEDVKETPEQLKSRLEKEERERVQEIEAIAAQFATRVPNLGELAKDAVTLKRSVDEFRLATFLKVKDNKPLESIGSEIGMSESDKKRWSISKFILGISPNASRSDKENAKFELECSDAVAKRIGKPANGGYVPYDIQSNPLTDAQRSVLVVGTASLGGNLVGTQIRPESFIELLRNRMLMLKLGVQNLGGLQQNVAIPKQSAAITGGWVTENAAPSQSNQTFGQITLSPKTFAAYTDYSRQLLIQSTPGVDGLVINDLAKVQALGIDAGIIQGSGAAGQPTGIVNTAGLTSASVASFTWAMAVQFETDVTTANADVATMSYICRPAVRGSLKGKVKVASYPVYMIDDDGVNMNGYPVYVTNQCVASTILFGDWSQTILGEFGILDLLVDPFTGSNAGTVRVTSFQSVDVGVRQIGAYSYGTSFS